MQWLQLKLCPCRARAHPSNPASSATAQSFLAEADDWEVIFENSGYEATSKLTSAQLDQQAKASAKTKSRRQRLLDPRDPRRNVACWPCFGKHIVQKCSNQHGSWTKCSRCSLRLSYQSKSCQSNENSSQPEDEVQIIAAALARLRRTCPDDEISADKVKAMIQIIHGECASTARISQ